MKAELITIGDEILIGQIVDTNSVWLGQKLNEIGVDIVQITSIQDDRKHIVSALDEAFKRADIILMTGGLGPTKDDITKYTLADYFQSDFVVNDEVLKNITHIFQSRGIPVMEVNRQQANVPDNCQVLFNQNGTAPGMWFEKEGTIVVSMPGVPYEMKGIMEDHVIPKLKSDYDTPTIVHKTILTHGLGESKLAEKVEDWRKSLALYDVKLAFLPSINGVRLRLSAIGDRTLQKVIDDKAEELKEIIPGLIYGYDTDTLEEVVGRALKRKKQTLSTAESCTGGNIAGKITRVSGSSNYFVGSVIAYDNTVKENMLGVSAQDIETHGAVSKQVVEQMAIGVRAKMGTNFSIATSGIAGPLGGTDAKPVGTIWIAVAAENEVISKMFRFGNDRERNVERTVSTALNLLRKQILNQ